MQYEEFAKTNGAEIVNLIRNHRQFNDFCASGRLISAFYEIGPKHWISHAADKSHATPQLMSRIISTIIREDASKPMTDEDLVKRFWEKSVMLGATFQVTQAWYQDACEEKREFQKMN